MFVGAAVWLPSGCQVEQVEQGEAVTENMHLCRVMQSTAVWAEQEPAGMKSEDDWPMKSCGGHGGRTRHMSVGHGHASRSASRPPCGAAWYGSVVSLVQRCMAWCNITAHGAWWAMTWDGAAWRTVWQEHTGKLPCTGQLHVAMASCTRASVNGEATDWARRKQHRC